MKSPRNSLQINLPPMETTTVARERGSRSTSVDQATALLRKAVCDCGYTLDALQAEMGKDRSYINKVLNGDKPVSLEFIVALPDDVEARYEQLRAEQFGLIVVKPSSGDDAVRNLVSGLVGVLGRKVVA